MGKEDKKSGFSKTPTPVPAPGGDKDPEILYNERVSAIRQSSLYRFRIDEKGSYGLLIYGKPGTRYEGKLVESYDVNSKTLTDHLKNTNDVSVAVDPSREKPILKTFEKSGFYVERSFIPSQEERKYQIMPKNYYLLKRR